MKKISLILLLLSLNYLPAKQNIIFMIGDGMGPSFTTAYRYYKDDISTKKVETTILDDLLVGSCSTYSNESPPVLTDSAAAGTALATGVKTKNGYIGLDENKKILSTLLERAKLSGYQTAMVVTSTLTHATPASFIAHHDNRKEETIIAKDYLRKDALGQLKFDLLIGGGLNIFKASFPDFAQRLRQEHISLLKPSQSLDDLHTLPAMVFIADDELRFAIDEDDKGLGKFRTQKMTQKALSLMDENKPFFMMIEGSQIDWCGHANDIACVMHEMDDFTAAIKVAKDYVDTHKNTLLIITADHSTGGLGIGQKIPKSSELSKKERKRKSYEWKPEVIKAVHISAKAMTEKVLSLADASGMKKLFKKYIGLDLSQKSLSKLTKERLKPCKKLGKCKLHDRIANVVNKQSKTGWTTHGHTAVDVPVFAYGKNASIFRGFMDNTELSKKLATLLK